MIQKHYQCEHYDEKNCFEIANLALDKQGQMFDRNLCDDCFDTDYHDHDKVDPDSI